MSKTVEARILFGETGSPVRWMTREQYAKASTEERLVAWMDSQVGAKESGKPNHGEEVREYLKSCGLGEGNPWCAALVNWCCKQAGLPTPKTGCAAVRSWVSHFAGNRVTQPARGSLFYWLDAGGTGHIGVCLGPSILGVFRTIEGNTNDEGGRDGDRCHKRTRTIAGLKRHQVWGFIELG